MLEKLSAQNIAAFTNKSTVSYANWVTTENQLKRCFWKKSNRRWRKKDKNADWNTSFNKTFYILQNQM